MAKDENVVNNNTSEQQDKECRLGLDENAKLVFPTLNHTLITSSIEMDGWFAQLFKAAFADFTGFRPCWNIKTGRFTITACFEQKQYDESAITAFEYGIKKQDKASGLNRINSLYRATVDGNRFHLTEDAKKMIARFIGWEGLDRSNKEVNWNSTEVVSQIGDPQSQMTIPAKTYNVINYIDPIILLKEMYGEKSKVYVGDNENGAPIIEEHPVEYKIDVIGYLPTQQYVQKEMQRVAMINQYYMMGQAVPEYLLYEDKTYSYEPVKLLISQIDGTVMESSANAVGLRYQNQLGIDS